MSSPEPQVATVVNFADFLEPPRPEPTPAGEGLVLEAPERDGLGAAPAPALGADEAATVLDPDVWFADAQDPDGLEPATVLVPEDVLRVAQDLAEEARFRLAPHPPTVEVDLGSFDDDDADLVVSPARRLWHRRARLAVPVATAGSLLALAVAAGAWVRATPATARPARVATAPAAPAPRLAAPAPRPTAPAVASRPSPPATDFTVPRPIATTAPRTRTGGLRLAGRRRFRRAHRHRLRAPTARRSRTDLAAKDLRRGRADYDLGDLHGALAWYVHAARVAPRDPDPRFGIALTAYELHHDRTAWRSLERALRIDPNHPNSNLLLGFMLQEAGRDKLAAIHYARYLKVAPKGEWARDVRSTLAHLGD